MDAPAKHQPSSKMPKNEGRVVFQLNKMHTMISVQKVFEIVTYFSSVDCYKFILPSYG